MQRSKIFLLPLVMFAAALLAATLFQEALERAFGRNWMMVYGAMVVVGAVAIPLIILAALAGLGGWLVKASRTRSRSTLPLNIASNRRMLWLVLILAAVLCITYPFTVEGRRFRYSRHAGMLVESLNESWKSDPRFSNVHCYVSTEPRLRIVGTVASDEAFHDLKRRLASEAPSFPIDIDLQLVPKESSAQHDAGNEQPRDPLRAHFGPNRF